MASSPQTLPLPGPPASAASPLPTPPPPLPDLPSTATTYAISPKLLESTYAMSPAAYLAANAPITNLLASAAVFHHHHHHHHHHHDGPPPRLLLVQRAPTDYFPLKWELPGGSVDVDDDSSFVAAAVRELREETGLCATAVVRWVGQSEFPEGDGGVRWWRRAVFEVAVDAAARAGDAHGGGDPPAVRLDPLEHVDSRWVTAQEVEQGRCGEIALAYASPEVKALLMRAFALHLWDA